MTSREGKFTHLHGDILVWILTWMPYKVSQRYLSVCKHWYHCIFKNSDLLKTTWFGAGIPTNIHPIALSYLSRTRLGTFLNYPRVLQFVSSPFAVGFWDGDEFLSLSLSLSSMPTKKTEVIKVHRRKHDVIQADLLLMAESGELDPESLICLPTKRQYIHARSFQVSKSDLGQQFPSLCNIQLAHPSSVKYTDMIRVQELNEISVSTKPPLHEVAEEVSSVHFQQVGVSQDGSFIVTLTNKGLPSHLVLWKDTKLSKNMLYPFASSMITSVAVNEKLIAICRTSKMEKGASANHKSCIDLLTHAGKLWTTVQLSFLPTEILMTSVLLVAYVRGDLSVFRLVY